MGCAGVRLGAGCDAGGGWTLAAGLDCAVVVVVVVVAVVVYAGVGFECLVPSSTQAQRSDALRHPRLSIQHDPTALLCRHALCWPLETWK
jgi:hypothetical protein